MKWRAEEALRFLEEGATVPFISRYRKEATGNLDKVQVLAVRDRAASLSDLDRRRRRSPGPNAWILQKGRAPGL